MRTTTRLRCVWDAGRTGQLGWEKALGATDSPDERVCQRDRAGLVWWSARGAGDRGIGLEVSWSTPGSDTKRLVATAYDRSADGFAGAADRVVFRYLAQPLIEALGAVQGTVLDIAAGAGAAGRHFHDTVALDLSMGSCVTTRREAAAS